MFLEALDIFQIGRQLDRDRHIPGRLDRRRVGLAGGDMVRGRDDDRIGAGQQRAGPDARLAQLGRLRRKPRQPAQPMASNIHVAGSGTNGPSLDSPTGLLPGEIVPPSLFKSPEMVPVPLHVPSAQLSVPAPILLSVLPFSWC